MNLDQLELGDVVIHDVPRGGGEEQVVLTGAPVVLDAGLQRYFRDKLRASLVSRGIEAAASEAGDGIVVGAVVTALANPGEFVSQSQAIALHLNDVQNGNNPPGLVVVIRCRVAGEDAIAIMKLEREQGIRFEISTEGEMPTVDLELLRQLTLTNKTRVFKTALLTASDPDDPSTLRGRVSDNQRGLSEGRGVAEFFLHTFLGCEVALNPGRTTQQFVNGVTAFVNSGELTPEQQGRTSLALLSALDSNVIDISPQEFVRDHVPAAHRSEALRHIAEHGLEPTQPFEKDTSLLSFTRLKVQFQSGLVLVGAGADFEGHVDWRSGDDPGVDVHDVISNITGK